MKIRARIHDLASDGSGVGRFEGKIVFVPGALPGEEVSAQVVKNKKDYLRASLLEVIERSPHRRDPPCPYFGRCGGCQLQHLDYAAQIEGKAERLRSALGRIAGWADPPRIERVPSPRVLGYRNRMTFPVRRVEGRPRCGFYQARSHSFLPVDACLTAAEEISLRIGALNRAVAAAEPFDERTGEGLLRHAMLRSFGGSDCQAVLVLAKAEPASIRLPGKEFSSVWINVNPDQGNRILGREIGRASCRERV